MRLKFGFAIALWITKPQSILGGHLPSGMLAGWEW